MKKSIFLFALGVLLAACSGKPSGSANAGSAPEAETTTPAQNMVSEPAPAQSAQQDEPQMAGNIRNALRNDVLKDDLNGMSEDQRRFSYEEYDLNGDGRNEYFVGFPPPNMYFCGSGGCTFYLLGHEGEVITRFTVSDPPVAVLPSKTNGWHDLAVYSDGSFRKLTFNGTKYPSNPSMAPKYPDRPSDDVPYMLNYDMGLPVYTF